MSNRTLRVKIARMGQCPILWGSHGCKKQTGHKGICVCDCGARRG